MSKVKINKESVGKRIAVSSAVLELLEAEVKRIKEKGPHYKLNESKLASAIIELFFAKYLNKECEQVEAVFFDKKIYFKGLIEKSTSEEDLAKSFDKFFNKSKIKKAKATHE